MQGTSETKIISKTDKDLKEIIKRIKSMNGTNDPKITGSTTGPKESESEIEEEAEELDDDEAEEPDEEDDTEVEDIGGKSAKTNEEYAYLIIVPNPFEGNLGIKRDTIEHPTHWNRLYWVKIGDGSEILDRVQQYHNPSQYISIIKLNAQGNDRPKIKGKKKAGKILEHKLLSGHRCGGMGKGSSEWRGLYSEVKENGVADGTTRQDLQNLLLSFFPLTTLMDGRPSSQRISCADWRKRLKIYLETSEPTLGWEDVISLFGTIVNKGKGSVGTKVGNSEALENFPRIYILATPSTREESRYLGIDNASPDILETHYWVKIGYSCTQHSTVFGFVMSQYQSQVPDLSFNGYLLNKELTADEQKKNIDDIWANLGQVLDSDHKLTVPTAIKGTKWRLITIKGGGDTRSPAINFLDKFITTFHETKGNPFKVKRGALSRKNPRKQVKVESALQRKVKWKEDFYTEVKSRLNLQEDLDSQGGRRSDISGVAINMDGTSNDEMMELLDSMSQEDQSSR
ncbi:unnamed protein product [Rhizoctonia solani]|uniref:Uncharacterized protein n=1 Tax=Rhizoctonia solani TaxID=456999 RepID=A0A8H3CST3_9AGAM|nr:unnamed protein product [Rhizoctonia solani]